ncbi:hypothetical protein ABZ990_09830 [Streptomyces sp. NPDC046203]|uniref:hypothetical protein n=1 Tax=Streptomyces sp. NPDC046203 TaxID=3154602 RepID=UPI0033F55336
MRPARDGAPGFPAFSATPIFDALIAEFRRAFRTLPGDRSGEEELLFRSFGTGRGQGPGAMPPAGPRPGGAPGVPGATAMGTGPGAMPRAGTGTGRGWSAYALPPGTGAGG